MEIFGLVEMTSGLVHLGYNLLKGQAGKFNLFVPCTQQTFLKGLIANQRAQISFVYKCHLTVLPC